VVDQFEDGMAQVFVAVVVILFTDLPAGKVANGRLRIDNACALANF
jgi:hypothetical protein